VVAGAGTGKTAVIAERFRRLASSGVAPKSILVMTFSERAAAEMRERIRGRLAPEDAELAVGTFHALALAWLREDGWRIGVPAGFQILTGAERWILARELMWDLADPALVTAERPDGLVTPLLKILERLKQELVPLQRLAAWCRDAEPDEKVEYLAAAVRLFRALERAQRDRRLLDFDDLLVGAVRLLEREPRLRQAYARRYRHLMVDEYQDTNLAQERLVELMGAKAESVFVVGDDDQSIYRFRGASRANMERFLRSFPDAGRLSLGTNRRSSARVVEASRALIEHNHGRLSKPVRANRGAGSAVEVSRHVDGTAEAAYIAQWVEHLRAKLAGSEIAVLVRTHAIARPILRALDARQIPHAVKGGQGFYERSEVRDLIATLRLVADPGDRIALARLLGRPPLQLEVAAGLARSAPGADALEQLRSWPPASEWATALLEMRALAQRRGVDEVFYELMERTGLLEAQLAAASALERPHVQANVARFAELVDEFCATRPYQSLRAFIEHLELVLLSGVGEEAPELEADADAVQVMTIHQAKGLEFEAVFVPAVVEGRLPQAVWRDAFELPAQVLEPSIRAREDHVAEERRLLYVAMTRARGRLFLSWAERYEGGRDWRPSRFLSELEGASAGAVVSAEPATMVIPDEPNGPPSTALAEETAPLALSFSAVASYRDCPRHYWYRYVLKVDAPRSIEARFGSVLHQTLMEAGQQRHAGGPVGERSLRQIYRRAWNASGLGAEKRRPNLEATGWKQLKAYLDSGGLAARPHLVEHSFTAGIDGWRLRGIIDRVDAPPPTQGGEVGIDAAWKLIDYKTGSPLPAARLKRDLQLALYALGAKEALGLEPLELEIVYLKTGRRVTIPAAEELLEEARRAGDEVADGIRNGRFEARPQPRRCQLCAYRLACPDAL
jgi:DNA helicase II / ATP-dependent DNA helicase PcrA